jgi:hypothetical protein
MRLAKTDFGRIHHILPLQVETNGEIEVVGKEARCKTAYLDDRLGAEKCAMTYERLPAEARVSGHEGVKSIDGSRQQPVQGTILGRVDSHIAALDDGNVFVLEIGKSLLDRQRVQDP